MTERTQNIRADIRKNELSFKEIADKYDLSKLSVYYHARAMNCDVKQRSSERIGTRNNQIVSLMLAGATIQEVSKRFQLSNRTIYEILDEFGIRYCRRRRKWYRVSHRIDRQSPNPAPSTDQGRKPSWEVMRIVYDWRTCYGNMG